MRKIDLLLGYQRVAIYFNLSRPSFSFLLVEQFTKLRTFLPIQQLHDAACLILLHQRISFYLLSLVTVSNHMQQRSCIISHCVFFS